MLCGSWPKLCFIFQMYTYQIGCHVLVFDHAPHTNWKSVTAELWHPLLGTGFPVWTLTHTFPVCAQTLASAGQVNPSMESTLWQDGHNVTSGCCSPWWHLLTEIPLPDYLSVAWTTCAVRYDGNTVFSCINALCLFPCFTGILAFSSITFSSEITEKTRPLLDSVTFSAAGPHLDVSLQPFHLL